MIYVFFKLRNYLKKLIANQNFLCFDPEVWPQLEDYNNAKEIVTAVRVVNDCAERAVKLASDFNTALTHVENQRQLMYQMFALMKRIRKTMMRQRTTVVMETTNLSIKIREGRIVATFGGQWIVATLCGHWVVATFGCPWIVATLGDH
ncbi:hypothetical protein HELRODRAFT_176214 [Helobdella robusta]|uniref:Uncharacterized protein n=1 Tax=Helobdella robusta TaxID=6412 RepID=T1FAA9_HELRO|nr:hypothetical protein HELRODRAFT_176214 [Helobdella robusta]ESN99918.1 hypothetical protein HELRODRAFT_176214 [Helobdella robusta]